MDTKAVDKALVAIIAKRIELQKLDYNNPKYDELEEELHDLEDDFQDAYGDALEDILQDVHDEHCPDSDVLYPIAYLAKQYSIDGNNYSVTNTEGVFVESEKHAGKETKLVLVPSPLRIILNIGKDRQEVVWKA
ncbi:MAG: hypothetical protein K1X47_16240 [Cyclobacteriaceae bacterium]|nr:hypothetical protein [Cyclobacteriaceae bacterium]